MILIKRMVQWACVLCLGLSTLSVSMAAMRADVPAQTSLLTDQVNALSTEEHDALLSRLRTIQHSGRAQAAILISRGTDGVPLADYALRIAEAWQLGRAGKDDGLLILIVPSINGARLEVGYGLEGVIPDARASQWLDELLPAIRNNELAAGLNRLLDRIEGVLPQPEAKPANDERYLFPDHPEWRLPFVLVVFSPFALFPIFFGFWGSIASALLLAAFLGGAALALWNSAAAAGAVAAASFVLPLTWGLNSQERESLAAWLRYARAAGNLIGVTLFFAVITLFTGAGLSAVDQAVWPAAIFSGLLSIGLAVFLFPGKAADYLMVILRSAMHFAFMLVLVYVALGPFIADPSHVAFGVAALVTSSVALGLYFDSRERHTRIRWSLWLYGLAIVIALPFALIALVMSVGGEDLQMQIAQAAAGGGSLAGILALAARYGFFAAVKIGLGGRFGGGGAGRSD